MSGIAPSPRVLLVPNGGTHELTNEFEAKASRSTNHSVRSHSNNQRVAEGAQLVLVLDTPLSPHIPPTAGAESRPEDILLVWLLSIYGMPTACCPNFPEPITRSDLGTV